MPLTPARRVLLGVGVTVMVVLTTGGNDPPVDVAGGSIYGTTQFFHHIWHQVESDGGSYSVVKTFDNAHITIQDGNGGTFDCTASQFAVSMYEKQTDLVPTAQLCTNDQCVLNDPDANIYLTSFPRTPVPQTRGRKRWNHSGLGLAWWKIQYEDDAVTITRIDLATTPTGTKPCPTSWSEPVQGHWHVLVDKAQ